MRADKGGCTWRFDRQRPIKISGLRERGKILVSLPNWRLSGLAGKKRLIV